MSMTEQYLKASTVPILLESIAKKSLHQYKKCDQLVLIVNHFIANCQLHAVLRRSIYLKSDGEELAVNYFAMPLKYQKCFHFLCLIRWALSWVFSDFNRNISNISLLSKILRGIQYNQSIDRSTNCQPKFGTGNSKVYRENAKFNPCHD